MASERKMQKIQQNADGEYSQHLRLAVIFKTSLPVLGHYILHVLSQRKRTGPRSPTTNEDIKIAIQEFNRINAESMLENEIKRLEEKGVIKRTVRNGIERYSLTSGGKEYISFLERLREEYFKSMVSFSNEEAF